jgi:rfaE bifunctional protein nucleotidyltransferase chain/domain
MQRALIPQEKCECRCGKTIARRDRNGDIWLKCTGCHREIRLQELMPSDGRFSKVCPVTEAQRRVDVIRGQGLRIVMTCGCFDLLHAGHVLYLEAARECGDYLVVALNSDASVRLNKGEGRPIHDENARARLLAALESVDLVILFAEKDAMALIALVRPHIWVKGGDYTIETMNQDERKLVEGMGGEVRLMGFVDHTSTSDIVEKIRDGA